MVREKTREYFSFTSKERIAVIALLGVILFLYLLPILIKPRVKVASADEIKEFRILERQLMHADSNHASVASQEIYDPPRLFLFDPNTVSATGWKQLGLRDKTISTIQKYVAGGGRFYKAADLKKIYGLKEEEYRRLESYIRIKPPPATVEAIVAGRSKEINWKINERALPETFKPSRTARSIAMIDINLADSSQWEALPGIGGKLAARILRFREKLGGFYNIEQVAETYGLPDSSFQRIKPFLLKGNSLLKMLDINKAALEELRSHPYIGWGVARELVRYREQHGPFRSVEDMQQLASLKPDQFWKVKPYLTVGH